MTSVYIGSKSLAPWTNSVLTTGCVFMGLQALLTRVAYYPSQQLSILLVSAQKVIPRPVWVEVHRDRSQGVSLLQLFESPQGTRLGQHLRLKFSVLGTGHLHTCSLWLVHTRMRGAKVSKTCDRGRALQ